MDTILTRQRPWKRCLGGRLVSQAQVGNDVQVDRGTCTSFEGKPWGVGWARKRAGMPLREGPECPGSSCRAPGIHCISNYKPWPLFYIVSKPDHDLMLFREDHSGST